MPAPLLTTGGWQVALERLTCPFLTIMLVSIPTRSETQGRSCHEDLLLGGTDCRLDSCAGCCHLAWGSAHGWRGKGRSRRSLDHHSTGSHTRRYEFPGG